MIINNLFQESADSRPDRTKHIVMVTVTDPQGTAVTQRKEPIQRRAVVSAVDRDSAIDSAVNFYKKQGYRVQDHHYVGPKDVDEGIVGDLAYKAGYGVGKVAGRGVAGYNAGKASNQPTPTQAPTPTVATSSGSPTLPVRKAPDAFAVRRAAAAKAAQDSMTPVTKSASATPSPEEIRKAKQAAAIATFDLMGRGQKSNASPVVDQLAQRRLAKQQGVKEGAEFGAYYSEQVAQQIFDKRQDISSEEEVLNQAYHIVANDQGQKSARYMFNYDEDFPGDVVSNYFHLQKQGVAEGYSGADDTDTVGFSVNSEQAYNAVMSKFGDYIDHDETSGMMYVPASIWPKVEMVAFDADGEGAVQDDGYENPDSPEQGMAESSQRVDSLVTDALKIMQGAEVSDAVQALKTVLGDREYNGRRGYYNFYVRQLMDMYSKQGVEEAGPYGSRNPDTMSPGNYDRYQQDQMDQGKRDFKRREHEAEWEQEQAYSAKLAARDAGTWYIRLNGKLIRDKQGNPYSFRGKAAANKAALTMQAKLFNQGKEFMLTTNPNDPQQGVAEGALNEFALPGGGDGDSGRWYTDDDLADIIGDDWFEDFDVSNDGFNIDAYGEKAKQNLVGYANSWFDDKGYNVNVLGVDHNDVDHDLKWYIVGSFQNDNFADKDVDEGLGSKLAGLGLAGAMALGSAGANARVTPDGQGGFTGGLKPSATVTAPADNTPAAEAPKGFSKEYLQKAADPNRFGRYMISVEKAQELLKQQSTNEDRKIPGKPDLWNRAKIVAESKFNVYPSKQASIYADKWYQQHGGTWINGKS